jgi:hypothetical protein
MFNKLTPIAAMVALAALAVSCGRQSWCGILNALLIVAIVPVLLIGAMELRTVLRAFFAGALIPLILAYGLLVYVLATANDGEILFDPWERSVVPNRVPETLMAVGDAIVEKHRCFLQFLWISATGSGLICMIARHVLGRRLD